MAPIKGNNQVQEISCSLCSKSADMAIVSGITYTICGYCGNIHVAETNQYISFTDAINRSPANTMSIIQRRLFIMAIAMEAIYEVYDVIYRELRKEFD